jgi:hypothetical protein
MSETESRKSGPASFVSLAVSPQLQGYTMRSADIKQNITAFSKGQDDWSDGPLLRSVYYGAEGASLSDRDLK